MIHLQIVFKKHIAEPKRPGLPPSLAASGFSWQGAGGPNLNTSGHPICYSWPVNGGSLRNSSTYPSPRALGCLTKQMAWDSSLALVPGSPQVPFLQSSARGTEPLPQVRGEKEMLGTSAASCLPIPLPASTPPGAHG